MRHPDREVLRQLEVIRQGTEELLPEDELVRKIERSLRSGDPLRVKQGFDPTAPDIHLGHTIGLRKLRQFQGLGHRIVLIVGDYTGMVGDPSGRNETRPRLTRDQVVRNADTYKKQFFKVLDPAQTEVRENGEWFGPMRFEEIMALASRMTVARLLERDDFEGRLSRGQPISLHELFYPIMQAYDSVAIRADVEIGATDQKFNLLAGRQLQQEFGQEPQVILTLPVLEGTDGVQRMSKSAGNYIGVDEAPAEIYGKVMSIPDTMILKYFRFLTDLPGEEIERISAALARPEVNPRDHKARLAHEIVRQYHGETAAREAAAAFERVFRDGGVPADLPEVTVPARGRGVWIVAAVREAGLAASASQARRLVQQGAVEVDGRRVQDENEEIVPAPGEGFVLRVGKRGFARVRVGPPSGGDRS
jgi:tyrosyl-tRNA synthetase